jgi:transposase-like protein
MVYLYFYFSDLSLRKNLKDYRLVLCREIICQSGIEYKQKYKPKKILERKKKERKKIEEFISDETLIKIGSELMI